MSPSVQNQFQLRTTVVSHLVLYIKQEHESQVYLVSVLDVVRCTVNEFFAI